MPDILNLYLHASACGARVPSARWGARPRVSDMEARCPHRANPVRRAV